MYGNESPKNLLTSVNENRNKAGTLELSAIHTENIKSHLSSIGNLNTPGRIRNVTIETAGGFKNAVTDSEK